MYVCIYIYWKSYFSINGIDTCRISRLTLAHQKSFPNDLWPRYSLQVQPLIRGLWRDLWRSLWRQASERFGVISLGRISFGRRLVEQEEIWSHSTSRTKERSELWSVISNSPTATMCFIDAQWFLNGRSALSTVVSSKDSDRRRTERVQRSSRVYLGSLGSADTRRRARAFMCTTGVSQEIIISVIVIIITM